MTRDELRDMHSRVCKIESLCFVDTPERVSLATLSRRVDAHITAICDYARVAKTIAAIGASILSILLNIHQFVIPLM